MCVAKHPSQKYSQPIDFRISIAEFKSFSIVTGFKMTLLEYTPNGRAPPCEENEYKKAPKHSTDVILDQRNFQGLKYPRASCFYYS